MKFVDEHPVLSLCGFLVGTMFVARVIQTGFNLSFNTGPLIWVGLIAIGFVAADKLKDAEREKSQRAQEIRQLRERTDRLEQEIRHRDERGTDSH